MPKRRRDDQLELAWSTRAARPNLEASPLKGDAAAKRAAQDTWVASWGGAPLANESRRAAWWKQSKKQHGELCKAYEEDQKIYGAASQSSTAASAAATALVAGSSSSSSMTTTAAFEPSSSQLPLSSALSTGASASTGAFASTAAPSAAEPSAAELSAAEPSAAEPSAADPSDAEPSAQIDLRRRLHVGGKWVKKTAPAVASLTVGAFEPTGNGRRLIDEACVRDEMGYDES